jgi:choloylglycine hydrolase
VRRERAQRFCTFGPEREPSPGQEPPRSIRAAAGSEDPRTIDSTWHIPPGWKKRELGLSQLTRVMVAVGGELISENWVRLSLALRLVSGVRQSWAIADCDYGKRDPKVEGIGVMQWAQYFLDNYATVAEAVEAMNAVPYQIETLVLPNGFPTLVHMSLGDKSGDSAVIEYIAGKAKVYHDKRFTVMTNEPTYDKQIENLKQYRTFGGDKPLPGERTPTDRFVRAAYYAENLPKPTSRDEGAAYAFSVIRNISVPFGKPDPKKPNVSSTIFRTVQDLTGGRYYFESTYAPNVVWVDITKLDFSKGQPEMELRVEKEIFKLNGDVTDKLEKAQPFVFGMNK